MFNGADLAASLHRANQIMLIELKACAQKVVDGGKEHGDD
jgi:hypothetical protein